MKRISPFTENRVLELWFEGIPRDTIAQRLGISGSTVSEFTSSLPENLKDLRRLSVELLKSHLSVSEATNGLNLLSKLAQLGVSPDQLQELIHTAERVCREANYEPKEVVQGAIRLSRLEEESSKSYPDALLDFQARKDNVETLEREEQELTQRLFEKESETKQALAKSKTTKKGIAYVTALRQSLRKHGVALEDVEAFHRYLENVREMGGNPKRFVHYTKKQGSLKRGLTQLRHEIQLETANLQRLRQEVPRAKATIDELHALFSLRGERNREQDTIETLRRNTGQMRQEYQKQSAALAKILQEERQQHLNVEFTQEQRFQQNLEQRTRDFENRYQSIENEIVRAMRARINYLNETITRRHFAQSREQQ